MRILVVDAQANSLDWCLRCLRAGHKVKLYTPAKPRLLPIGQGLVERVTAWQPWVEWADLIFLTDNTLFMREMDMVRARGGSPPIIGGTEKTATWELDRDIGMKLFKSKGIAIAPTKEFTDYDAAIKYVIKEDRAFVSKPSGDADKALSYVGKSPEDMVYMLQRWKALGRNKAPFILQEKITGCEMAVGGWFGPRGFTGYWCENWEFKKLCNGDMGPNTGEQGTILRYTRESKLARKVLQVFADDLGKEGYVGYIDVNCIIDDKGTPWPLEFTMRPGWPTFNIQQVLHEGDPAEWLMDLATGNRVAPPSKLIAAGIVLSVPDYPYNKIPADQMTGIPVYGITPSTLPFLHPCEMAMGVAPQRYQNTIVDLPMMVTAGTYILVGSGTGASVEEAKRHAYQTLGKLSLPNSPMYRTDIGQRLRWQLPKLQERGYALGMTYAGNP